MSNIRSLGAQTPLVYASSGTKLDNVQYQYAANNGKLLASEIIASLVRQSPLVALEKTVDSTGAGQIITYSAPIMSDPNLNGVVNLLGFDLALQLNEFAIPRTAFNFTVNYFDTAGNIMPFMTQQFSGTASIKNGSNRQFIRVLPFLSQAQFFDGGPISRQPQQFIVFPQWIAPDPADLAAFNAVIPSSVWTGVLSDKLTVSKFELVIPNSAMSPNVPITVSPITSGRLETLRSILAQLINADQFGNSFISETSIAETFKG